MERVEIACLDDLQDLESNNRSHNILINDIDASETEDWNNGNGFVPIKDFAGVLDGNGHTIRNLHIERNGDHRNLLGFIRNLTGEIRDITFENCRIIGSGIVGIVGKLNTRHTDGLENVSVENSVIHGDVAGGLVGFSRKSKILECEVSNSTVLGGEDIGGLVGENKISELIGCKVIDTHLCDSSSCGGLVGVNKKFNSKSSKIKNSVFDESQVTRIKMDNISNKGGFIGKDFEKFDGKPVGSPSQTRKSSLKWEKGKGLIQILIL